MFKRYIIRIGGIGTVYTNYKLKELKPLLIDAIRKNYNSGLYIELVAKYDIYSGEDVITKERLLFSCYA